MRCNCTNVILPLVQGKLVHGLIATYGLTKKLVTLAPKMASLKDLQSYHSPEYLSFLKENNSCSDHEDIEDQIRMETFGLGYDCPVFAGMLDYCCAVSGATLTAVNALLDGRFTTVVNWFGGWHHGRRSKAAGFCYCNDIVLAILRLLDQFKRVLYVDIDLHHGDGVEEAFRYTNKVMTVSFHKQAPGFFPGTGEVESIGKGKGHFYTVNVPLKDGITDQQFSSVFTRVMDLVRPAFSPEVVVLQCGADGLNGDPMNSFSLTPHGLGECVAHVASWHLPMLVLGGGGYDFPSTARCWTHVTGLLVKETLDNDIPEHEYYDEYGPDYSLHCELPSLLRRNGNSDKDLDQLVDAIRGNLFNIHETSKVDSPQDVSDGQ
nr:histone deacetylase 8 [Halisarca dujardinii]